MSPEANLLDAFLSVARSDPTTDDIVLECYNEQWTYGELDTISSALALELHEQFGTQPTVTSISENHPYLLAVLLATWKLGGIFAPLDPHAPPEMLVRMLENISPTCIVIPENARSLSDKMQIPAFAFSIENSTVMHLLQRYMHHAPQDADGLCPPPSSLSLALYLHTSSASSASNLKCVPISHDVLARGSYSRLNWFRSAWPETQFEKLRVFGWTPWSHIMGVSHDLGAATFASGGCYVFGVLPPGYPTTRERAQAKNANAVDNLLEGVLDLQPDVLIGVPWMLNEIHAIHSKLMYENTEQSLREAARIQSTLSGLKYLGLGGAQTTKETMRWALALGIRIAQDMGMTELGRPLFHSKVADQDIESEGWSLDNCLIDDADLFLIDDTGKAIDHEGELVVTSSFINSSYLKYDNSAFSQTPDGRITFRTGDIYARNADAMFVWKGRKEDYIQMVTSETLDPREIEKTLNSCAAIADCCIVGNNFLKKPSEFICAIISPTHLHRNGGAQRSDRGPTPAKQLSDITRAIASVNRTLPPPLRVAWSRVLLLDEDIQIPRTKKGAIFRKKLEDEFGALLLSQLTTTKVESKSTTLSCPAAEAEHPNLPSSEVNRKTWKQETVESLILTAVAEALGTSLETLRSNPNLSFAEFGMDSSMAVQIVNTLNSTFALRLPLNTCHTFVDLTELLHAILEELGMVDMPTDAPSLPKSSTPPSGTRVVIVGQAFRLPGDINTPQSFWDALVNKRDNIITHVPAERWDHKSFYRSPSSTAPPQPCEITFEKAGFVDVAHYDNTFFGISAPEAIFVGPTIRLTLETAFEALENACIPISRVKGTSMGVFVGSGLDAGYHQLLYEDKGFETYSRFYGTGMAPSTACGRLSYLLDVHGPSVTLDTACSSGLVAFDQGVKYLQSGKGESAIVSAVSTNLWPGSFGFLSAQKMTSPNSRCATFTDEADGYVPSEGCVTFILKTEAAALRDGDNILAVIKASDVMHGGKSQGLVAPNVHAQVDLQRQLLGQANLKPADIDFLEAHGTGTSLGDLIEIQGINQVFQGSHPQTPLIVGAAKSCIGHTELAAGLVGVLKAIASFEHASVPGVMHLTENNMNPAIDCSIVPLHIPHQVTNLPQKDLHNPHRGLVLANGFAGTIAGAILESPAHLPGKRDSNLASRALRLEVPTLFVVSAKSADGLHEYLRRYLHFCKTADPSKFQEICYTSCLGREHYRHRFACVISNLEELIIAIDRRIGTRPIPRQDTPARRVVFAFPGQGSHYAGMASALAEQFPEFEGILNKAAAAAETLSGYPITSLLLDSGSSFDVHSVNQTAQICIFVYQYSSATWLKQLGITPYGVLGHSLGEIAGAVIAGALSFDLGLELVVRRAEILISNPGYPGGMAIVAASKDIIAQLIREQGLGTELVIAVYNGPESHVISGSLSAVDTFISRAKNLGLRSAKLHVSQAFHSPLIWPSLPALQEWVVYHQKGLSGLDIQFYSTVYGKEFSPNSLLPPFYWVEHAREPVRFFDAANALISDSSVEVIMDIGPQPFIATLFQDVSHGKVSVATSTKPSKDQLRSFLGAIASLFEFGVTPHLEKLFSGRILYKVSIPSYPFQRRRHFPHYIPSRHPTSTSRNVTSKAATSGDTPFLVDIPLYDLLSDHQIEGRRIVPGAALVDFFALQSPLKALRSITFHAPMVVGSPHTPTSYEFDKESGIFCLKSGDANPSAANSVISSGIAGLEPLVFSRRAINAAVPYESRRNKADAYSSFANVDFGPLFQNIQELRIWSTHVDSHIDVKPTKYPRHDRIRKLDCCLHGIGAIVHLQVPQAAELAGSFLPASLEGFVLHTDEIPDAFICRYYVPLEATRNFHVVSTAFEVLSHSGDLLISCAKYSLAWIPTGSAVQNKEGLVEENKLQWFHQSWVPRSIVEEPRLTPLFVKYDRLLYVGYHDSRLAKSISAYGHQVFSVYLPTTLERTFIVRSKDKTSKFSSLKSCFDDKYDTHESMPLSVILDLTAPQTSHPRAQALSQHDVLELMQLLMSRKVIISNFTLISELAASLSDDTSHDHITDLSLDSTRTGSVVHGMLKVFRRETGFDTQIWALDLPRVDEATASAILLRELRARLTGVSVDRVIAYRFNGDHILQRVVPVLLPMANGVEVVNYHTGTTIIVGMGSIGYALAQALLPRGGKVVFIGRRPLGDAEVQVELARSQSENGVAYVQADVNDLDSLRTAVANICASYGSVAHIIHTAAVVRDATIQNVDKKTFDTVLAPKVTGAWNLHIVSAELCPSLRSFVLLSSISVSLGNQGQVGYVAGNYYMEVLAAHRQQHGLPAVCIQLGAWESRLTQTMDDVIRNPVQIMSHEEGIPRLLKAMAAPQLVQVVANLDLKMLADNPAYSLDPFFQEILPRRQRKKETEVSLNAFNETMEILRTVLELQPSDSLETTDTMTGCGIDSISFAQIRGRVMHQLGVEVPTKFLSDSFTVHEMVDYVVRQHAAICASK